MTATPIHHSAAKLDTVFSALADPTRRAILGRLARGPSSVTGLAAPFRISLPAVSRHLKVLEGAGLLARTREGRVHRCRLVAAPLHGAALWIDRYRRFWEGQFDALARYLNETSGGGATWPGQHSIRRRGSPSRGPSGRRGRPSSGRGPTRRS